MEYFTIAKIHSSVGVISTGEIVKPKLPKKEIEFLLAKGALRAIEPDTKDSLPAAEPETLLLQMHDQTPEQIPDEENIETADVNEKQAAAHTPIEAEPVGEIAAK